jgi:hypothetical protein
MMHFCLLLLAGTIFLQSTVVHMESASTTLHKYNISGTIYCSASSYYGVDIPTKGRNIYLKEKDNWPNWDDTLDETVTDGQGHFQLVGEEDEGNEPEPFIGIPYGCTGFLGVRMRQVGKTGRENI